MTLQSSRWARRAGLLLGLVLAAAALTGWRVAPGGQALGLDLTLSANSTGELGLSPSGRLGARTGLAPGDSLAAETSVTNQTGRRLAVRVRALPSSHELDRTLAIRLRSGDRTLFEGRLGELREFTRRPLMLAGGSSARLALDARLPAGATGWQGRIEDVVLDLRSEPLR